MHRILRTIPSYFPFVSGPANQARAISAGLVAYGYRSRIVTTSQGVPNAPRSEAVDGVPVLRAPIQAGFMQYQVALGAWAALGREPADLIHVHSYRNFLADAAALLALRNDIPLVLHLHGTLAGFRQIAPQGRWWLYKGYDLLSAPLGLLRSAQIVVSTAEERREAEGYGLDPERITVIPMGIAPEEYRFADLRRDPLQIVFVGRLTEDRNPALVLRALARLGDLPWRLTLVGDETRRSFATELGYVDTLKRLAAELGIADRVSFAGQLRGEALRRAYAGAGIFVYPSRYENFGQTILEAAAAGCALLTTPVGVAHELVADGRTGFRIEGDEPEPLAARLRHLLERPAEQRAMGAAAQALASDGFAWKPILRRYADLYDRSIAERSLLRWPHR
jgi:D-inositol-3-phosphate glycosyltransferase